MLVFRGSILLRRECSASWLFALSMSLDLDWLLPTRNFVEAIKEWDFSSVSA